MLFLDELQRCLNKADEKPRILDVGDPDYIFARAKELQTLGLKSSPEANRSVDKVLRFLAMMNNATLSSAYRARVLFKEIFESIVLKNHQSDLRSLFIECGILTGAPDSTIARFAALNGTTVQAYGRLFFNIRERIADGGYVMGVILRPVVAQMHGGFGGPNASHTDPLPADVWRFIAYILGWESFVQFAASHEFMGEAAQRIQQLATKGEAVKLLVAVLLEEATRTTAPAIMERTWRRTPVRDAIEPMPVGAAPEDEVMEELRKLSGKYVIGPIPKGTELGKEESCRLLGSGEQLDEPAQ